MRCRWLARRRRGLGKRGRPSRRRALPTRSPVAEVRGEPADNARPHFFLGPASRTGHPLSQPHAPRRQAPHQRCAWTAHRGSARPPPRPPPPPPRPHSATGPPRAGHGPAPWRLRAPAGPETAGMEPDSKVAADLKVPHQPTQRDSQANRPKQGRQRDLSQNGYGMIVATASSGILHQLVTQRLTVSRPDVGVYLLPRRAGMLVSPVPSTLSSEIRAKRLQSERVMLS